MLFGHCPREVKSWREELNISSGKLVILDRSAEDKRRGGIHDTSVHVYRPARHDIITKPPI